MVEVYYNTHKQCLSIRQKGVVIRHAKTVLLSGATFRVQQGGRQRVVNTGRKNVHAFVRGHLDFASDQRFPGRHSWERIYYDPFKHTSFVRYNGEPVHVADEVLITGKDIYI
jgi:hypothetical protein